MKISQMETGHKLDKQNILPPVNKGAINQERGQNGDNRDISLDSKESLTNASYTAQWLRLEYSKKALRGYASNASGKGRRRFKLRKIRKKQKGGGKETTTGTH